MGLHCIISKKKIPADRPGSITFDQSCAWKLAVTRFPESFSFTAPKYKLYCVICKKELIDIMNDTCSERCEKKYKEYKSR